jgi:HEAT repeat protein
VLATLGKVAFSSLVIALKDSLHVIREYAAIALGKLGDTRALKPLISSLDDKAWNVRLRIAWALAQMKGKKQIAPLTQTLKKEENDFVRAAITKALKKLR